jgi:hypothetical protein
VGALDLFPLGQPKRSDVRLAGLLTEDLAEAFAMAVDDYEAVYGRAAGINSAAERSGGKDDGT